MFLFSQRSVFSGIQTHPSTSTSELSQAFTSPLAVLCKPLLLPVQASQASAASGTQAYTLRLQQARASIAQLNAELQPNQRLLQRDLRECQGWASRHQHTVTALRDQLPRELVLPDSHWMFAQAHVPLGG